ncbi:MAG: prepilin-type N-terminal cleavage/methylation domain-containing protein [Gammaproteobacteria bacterium]|nr:prepilin-type N-terminal cleavage/methylation domain-containing protein [Gammaproteobacteria bacterium]
MKKNQSGFTLIEIAIVMVIIGLLLGGVLKGQEMINSAKVRAVNNRVDGVAASWFAFQDRYRALPGDYTTAATNIPPIGAIAPVNGSGDGLIGTNAERGQVWFHLAAAGFISGSYDGTASAAATYNCPTTRCADNSFSVGMLISNGNEAQNNTGTRNELITGMGISSSILAELDRKIDDGFATSGTMQLGNGGAGWAAAAVTACLNGTGYQTVTPSANCAAVLRNI